MAMKPPVPRGSFRTACGRTIEITARSIQHLEAHPEVASILVAAINKAVIGDCPFAEIEVDMGQIVGRQNLVATGAGNPNDVMEFSVRKGRSLPSRVISGITQGDETSSIVIIAKRTRPGHYILITSWLGNLAEKEPWDPNIRGEAHFDRCLQFWCANALIHDQETMGPVFQSTWAKILRCREKNIGVQRDGFNRDSNCSPHERQRNENASRRFNPFADLTWENIDFMDGNENSAGAGSPMGHGVSRNPHVRRTQKTTTFRSPRGLSMDTIYGCDPLPNAAESATTNPMVTVNKRRSLKHRE